LKFNNFVKFDLFLPKILENNYHIIIFSKTADENVWQMFHKIEPFDWKVNSSYSRNNCFIL